MGNNDRDCPFVDQVRIFYVLDYISFRSVAIGKNILGIEY